MEPKIESPPNQLSTCPTIPSAVGTLKLLKASISVFDGPAQGDALKFLISGQFGSAQRKDSNPRIKSIA